MTFMGVRILSILVRLLVVSLINLDARSGYYRGCTSLLSKTLQKSSVHTRVHLTRRQASNEICTLPLRYFGSE